MKKIMYTRAEDGGVSIVVPAPKEDIERVLGPISDEQYTRHVWGRSVPSDAINPRYVESIPTNREFRNAWCDVTLEPNVDICLTKAKEIQLAKLRECRNKKLADTDVEFMVKLEKGEDLTIIKQKKQALRDATEPLKNLVVTGYNDPVVLARIKTLGTL